MSAADIVVVVTTHPEEGADALAAILVERRLAACVQVIPGVSSTYRWRGSVEVAEEVRLEIKTRADRVDDLVAAMDELHPYDVPEMIVLAVTGGHPAYLRWVQEGVGPA